MISLNISGRFENKDDMMVALIHIMNQYGLADNPTHGLGTIGKGSFQFSAVEGSRQRRKPAEKVDLLTAAQQSE